LRSVPKIRLIIAWANVQTDRLSCLIKPVAKPYTALAKVQMIKRGAPVSDRSANAGSVESTQAFIGVGDRKAVYLAILLLAIIGALVTYKATAALAVIQKTQNTPVGVFDSTTAKVLAVGAVALIAVPLAMPTFFFEIPLALVLLSLGAPPAAAVAMLIAGPAINLPSLLTIGRATNWKVASTVALSVLLLALAGGLLASLL
jgi:hypothetical protein